MKTIDSRWPDSIKPIKELEQEDADFIRKMKGTLTRHYIPDGTKFKDAWDKAVNSLNNRNTKRKNKLKAANNGATGSEMTPSNENISPTTSAGENN